MKTQQPSFDFDDPPVRHVADKEPPAPAESLNPAEKSTSGDVRAPVYDWLADYVSGKG